MCGHFFLIIDVGLHACYFLLESLLLQSSNIYIPSISNIIISNIDEYVFLLNRNLKINMFYQVLSRLSGLRGVPMGGVGYSPLPPLLLHQWSWPQFFTFVLFLHNIHDVRLNFINWETPNYLLLCYIFEWFFHGSTWYRNNNTRNNIREDTNIVD